MNALQSILTPITHHIPFFLREPAEALIGEQCYTSLVYNVHLTDVECLKYALSKGLGLGIVLGGAIVKIPQIVKIVQTRSARGLSLTAYILETTSYAVCLAYASRNKFPFSTYGENFFLTLQNVIITLLILYFSGSRATNSSGLDGKKPLSRGEGGNVKRVIAGAATAAIGGLTLWSPSLTPLPLLGVLQAITLPISLLSKAPQIMSNHKAKSTGNLSAFAVFNALLGCLARLFTTKQEVNDPLIFWGFAGAALLNLVLAGQMVTYWNNGEESPVSTRRKPSVVTEAKQAAGAEESGSGRRWARKLD